ncbi:MAG: peptide chain release factor-like protein [Planctomycetota bacterium]
MDDDEALAGQCRFEYLKGSGPGGQNRNRRMTAVRLIHEPSGLVIFSCEQRTQGENRRVALERLREKLAERNRVVLPRIPTRTPRGARRQRREDKAARARVKQNRRGPARSDLE